jgi:hypothetical protein
MEFNVVESTDYSGTTSGRAKRKERHEDTKITKQSEKPMKN